VDQRVEDETGAPEPPPGVTAVQLSNQRVIGAEGCRVVLEARYGAQPIEEPRASIAPSLGGQLL
jgi:hypothetical protein